MKEMSASISQGKTVRTRLIAACVGEVVYLAGRLYAFSAFDDRHLLEAVLTAWRLLFVALYLWLFLGLVMNADRREPLPRHPLLVASILLFLATMPLAHHGLPFDWPADLFEIVAIPVVALREELFYRVILQNALERVVGPVPVVMSAAMLFAMSHIGVQPINLATVSSFIGAGVVLGVVYQHTHNLWLVTALHALADFLVWIPHSDPMAPSIGLVANLAAALAALTWLSLREADRRMGV